VSATIMTTATAAMSSRKSFTLSAIITSHMAGA
jgi:hypothetical protein